MPRGTRIVKLYWELLFIVYKEKKKTKYWLIMLIVGKGQAI